MPYSYRKLRGRIVEVFGTQAAFSLELGLSKISVSKKLTGKTEFSQSDVEKWAGLLGIKRCEYGEFFYT